MFRKKLVEVLDLILNLNSKDQCDLIYETGQKLNEINLNIIKFINEIIAYQNAIIFYYNVGSSDNLNDFEKTYNINIGISKQKSNKFDLKKSLTPNLNGLAQQYMPLLAYMHEQRFLLCTGC